MSVLKDKNVLLGVTAGIAAYKSAFLTRLLIKAGAHVKVIMTPASKDFVTPLTLSTLSKNKVFSSFTSEEDENEVWNNHVELGLWADLFIIAPATANTLSKMTNGTCDNLLLATYLSAKCPVYLAPAMDLDMYKHPSTKQSLEHLASFGNHIIPAEKGELASGLQGEGRMAEPEHIMKAIEQDLESKLPLRHKKVLISAGPTYEAIDPVRFIGNHSSGKMGFEIAEVAAKLGAQVILVAGPTALQIRQDAIERHDVTSANEMYNEMHNHYDNADIVIMTAAVADYRPANVAAHKIKKTDTTLSLKLEKTQDILKSLGECKTHQFLVGFALETQNEVENATQKLKRKNLDAIVLNSLQDKGAGFGSDTNKVTFITAKNQIIEHVLKSKTEVAEDLINFIIQHHA